ncbi:flagellin [Rhizobium sp. LjRoot30]|uniref:flagellin n=1 Tax=Rhizobium sp. LjRoot30 TaxID=3342320 RepID=UPI003ED0FE6D
MPLSINTNIASLNAQYNLSKTANSLANSMTRLSAGLRISGSDPAERLAAALAGSGTLGQSSSFAGNSAHDVTNMLSVADSALSSTTDSLQRMLLLAQQAANGTTSAAQKENIGAEFSKVKSAIESISKNTSFNGEKLLSVSEGATGVLTYRTSETATEQIDLSKNALYSSNAEDGILTRSYGDYHLLSSGNTPASSKEMKITAETTVEEATDMVVALKGMIDGVSSARATVGATQSVLNYDMQSRALNASQLSQSTSSIMDIEVVRETANLALDQIRQQASVSILSRTNENAIFLRDLLR